MKLSRGQVLVETALAAVGLIVLAFVIVRVGIWLNASMVERNRSFQATRVAAGSSTPGAPFAAPPPIHLIGPGADSTGGLGPQGLLQSSFPPDCVSGHLTEALALNTDLQTRMQQAMTDRDRLRDLENKAADLVTEDPTTGRLCRGDQCKGANWYWKKAKELQDLNADIAAAEDALAACQGGGKDDGGGSSDTGSGKDTGSGGTDDSDTTTGGTTTGKGGGKFGEHRVLPGQVRISSRFGAVGDAPAHATPHTGLDLSAPAGTPVLAYELGTVVATGMDDDTGYGRYIVLEHGNSVHTLYGHLRRIYVRDGERVEAGQFIGEVGSTGASTGAHLHFELLDHGRPVDPEPHLRLIEAASWDGVVPAFGPDKDEEEEDPTTGGSSGGTTKDDEDSSTGTTKDDTGTADKEEEPDCSAEQAALDALKARKAALCAEVTTGNPWVDAPPPTCDPAALRAYAVLVNNEAHATADEAAGKAEDLQFRGNIIQSDLVRMEQLNHQARTECASGRD